MAVQEFSNRAARLLGDVPVIDVDTHFTEPPNLWTSRASARFKDQVPRVVDNVTGNAKWMMGDIELGDARAAGVISRDGSKSMGTQFIDWDFSKVHEGAYLVKPRLELMDKMGIFAQIVYPNLVGFAGHKFDLVKDPELRYECIRIYNDAMAEFQAESGGRLFPMAVLPWWDIERSVKEIARTHALGLRGVNTNTDPHLHGLPDLSDAKWNPMWEAASSLNMPVNFHIGASATSVSWFGDAPWPSFSDAVKLALGSAVLYLSNVRVLGNLIYSGIFERFPKLKMVSVESGIGWIPFFLEALDHQESETSSGQLDHLSMKPSDYFRRQIYGTFWFERRNIANNIRVVGVDNCMFETDFPHPTCLYPDPLESAWEGLIGFSDGDRRKVLSSNAAKLYSISVPDRFTGKRPN
jgi:uncharacterized protein